MAPVAASSGAGSLSKKLFFTGIVSLLALGFLLAVEGVASVVSLGMLARSQQLAERVHTSYDPELGWANLRNANVPDMYGPGIHLRTSSQGFRGAYSVAPERRAGAPRVICSGDSMTLGYGVDDDHTYCALLGAAEGGRGIETVNMGQGGYGVDQAYLWFMRDGVALEHDVQLFAFIVDDFKRMITSTFSGYGKPTLRLGDDGALLVEDVPVPRQSGFARAALYARQLEIVQLVRRFTRKQKSRAERSAKKARRVEQLAPVVAAVFDELQAWHRANGSELVLVFLPEQEDYTDAGADLWRDFVREHAREQGIHFVDLVPAIRGVPADELRSLYFQPGDLPFFGSEGHYTNRGNRFIADALREALAELPGVGKRLGLR